MSETLLQTPELLDVPDIDVGFELDLSERLRARLRARLFNPGVTPPRPEPRFFINGVGISTAGNLTALSAAVKNGKSGFIAAMVAAASTRWTTPRTSPRLRTGMARARTHCDHPAL